MEESKLSLNDGYEESSFRCLRHFFLSMLFFGHESDDDVSDESDDEGSGSSFTSGMNVSSCFELSVDCVS